MKTFLWVLVLVGLVVAFALGWWSEHGQRLALQQELALSGKQLAQARSEIRLYRLQDRLLSLRDLIQAGDYATAQSASSEFFDAVRTQITTGGSKAPVLQMILAQRDSVTAAIARKDSAVADTLRTLSASLMKLQPQLPAVPHAPLPSSSPSAPPADVPRAQAPVPST